MPSYGRRSLWDLPVRRSPILPLAAKRVWREIEVLRLLAAGSTDREIGEQLFVSRRTAATHVAHIFSKIGVSSRAAAATWAVRNGLV